MAMITGKRRFFTASFIIYFFLYAISPILCNASSDQTCSILPEDNEASANFSILLFEHIGSNIFQQIVNDGDADQDEDSPTKILLRKKRAVISAKKLIEKPKVKYFAKSSSPVVFSKYNCIVLVIEDSNSKPHTFNFTFSGLSPPLV